MEANKRGTGRTRSPDAIALLKEDHERVRQLVQQYRGIGGSTTDDEARKSKLAERICQELEVHTQLEEELFYPSARTVLGADEHLLDEAEVEHGVVRDLIRQIQGLSPDDHGYDARVTVLGEYVAHHLEEEEKQMFPRVKRARLDLAALGDRLRHRRGELESELSMQPFEALASMLTLPIRAAAAVARAGAAAGRRAVRAGPAASARSGSATRSAASKSGTRAAPKAPTRTSAKAPTRTSAKAGAKAAAKPATQAGAQKATRGAGSRAASSRAATEGGGARASAGEARKGGTSRTRKTASAAGARGTAPKKGAAATRRSRGTR